MRIFSILAVAALFLVSTLSVSAAPLNESLTLTGNATYGVNGATPTGTASYTDSGTGKTELKVACSGINANVSPINVTLTHPTITPTGVGAGTSITYGTPYFSQSVTVASGAASLDLRSDRGATVPAVSAGDLVQCETLSADWIARGNF